MVQSRRGRRDARAGGPGGNEAGQGAAIAETAAAPGAAAGTLSDGPATTTLAGDEAAGPVGSGALNDLLNRADKVFAAPAAAASSSSGQAPAIVMDANSLPGACMGVTGLFSLGLYRLRLRELGPDEAQALTNALLRNLTAWNITIEDPRAAAAVDLVGCASGIVMVRVLEKLRELEEVRRRSPVQSATVAREEAPAPAAASSPASSSTPPPRAADNHTAEYDGAGVVAALTS